MALVHVAVNNNVIFEELDGEIVLLDLTGGIYYKLNTTGSQIWSFIREHGDSERVAEAMIAEYDVEAGQARREIALLVDDLEAHGLVVVERS